MGRLRLVSFSLTVFMTFWLASCGGEGSSTLSGDANILAGNPSGNNTQGNDPISPAGIKKEFKFDIVLSHFKNKIKFPITPGYYSDNLVTILEDGQEMKESTASLSVYDEELTLSSTDLPSGSALPLPDTWYWGHISFTSPPICDAMICGTWTVTVAFSFLDEDDGGTGYFSDAIVLKSGYFGKTPYLCSREIVDLGESVPHVQVTYIFSDKPC